MKLICLLFLVLKLRLGNEVHLRLRRAGAILSLMQTASRRLLGLFLYLTERVAQRLLTCGRRGYDFPSMS